MSRKRRNNQRSKPRRQRNSGNAPPVSTGVVLRTVPRAPSSVIKIRRAWNQQISYIPTSGFFLGGPNLQINFSASASEIRIGGVLVYGPTLINSSEFSNMFDQYRITQVTLRCDWNTNSVSPAELSAAAPLIYSAVDYDDSQNATVADLLQYPGVNTHSFYTNGYSPLIMKLSPTPLKDVAGAGLSTGYSPDTSRSFIRTTELSIPHYGVKIATTPLGASSSSITGYILLTAFVDLEFINPK